MLASNPGDKKIEDGQVGDGTSAGMVDQSTYSTNSVILGMFLALQVVALTFIYSFTRGSVRHRACSSKEQLSDASSDGPSLVLDTSKLSNVAALFHRLKQVYIRAFSNHPTRIATREEKIKAFQKSRGDKHEDSPATSPGGKTLASAEIVHGNSLKLTNKVNRKAEQRVEGMLALRRYILFVRLCNQELLVGSFRSLPPNWPKPNLTARVLHESVNSILDGYFDELKTAASSNYEHVLADLLEGSNERKEVTSNIVAHIRGAEPQIKYTNGELEANMLSDEPYNLWRSEIDAFEPDQRQACSKSSAIGETFNETTIRRSIEHFLFEERPFKHFLLQLIASTTTDAGDLSLHRFLMTLPKDTITFNELPSSGRLDRLMNYIEQHSVCRWNWWPLPCPKSAVSLDDMRIMWTCVSASVLLVS